MTLQELATYLYGKVQGAPETQVECVCGVDEQHQHAITFAENLKAAVQAEKQGFSALIVNEHIATKLPSIVVAQPRVAYAKALALFYPAYRYSAQIHPRSVVSSTAIIASDAYVGPYAIIDDGAIIEANAVVEAHAHLGKNSILGSNSRLLAHASTEANCRIGKDCLIGARTRIGQGTVIGDDVEIGARCFLNGCTISPKCRIDNLVTVEQGANLAPGAIMVGQTTVETDGELGMFSILAAQASVRSGAKVGAQAQVGGRVAVIHSIPAGNIPWSGNPPLSYREDMQRLALRNRVPELCQHLEELRRNQKLSKTDI